VIEMGIIVGAGLLWTLTKLPWSWRMHILSNPVLIDTIILIGMILIHWGSFSGLMIASISALTCSLTLSAARWLVGHVEDGTYVAGYYDMSSKLV